MIYWPRTGEQFRIGRRLCHGARASDARLMSTAALKRELALLRSSLAALTPAQSATLDDPVAWAERIAGLTLDPWQREVLLSASPRLLLNATRQSGKSTVAALKAAWTVLPGQYPLADVKLTFVNSRQRAGQTAVFTSIPAANVALTFRWR